MEDGDVCRCGGNDGGAVECCVGDGGVEFGEWGGGCVDGLDDGDDAFLLGEFWDRSCCTSREWSRGYRGLRLRCEFSLARTGCGVL